jgi:outer membrane protein
MKRYSTATALAAALIALAPIGDAVAAGAGNWDFKFGAHHVNPKSDNGSLAGGALDVEVGSNTRPTFNFAYWVTDNVQIDLLAAVPFQHDVDLNGASAAEFKHLPPTLTAQYHFTPGERICPYIGAGVNYTLVYDEDTEGPIAGTDLELDNSFGLSAVAGIEFELNDKWAVGADVRWFDIDADAEVDGDDVGEVNVDPFAFGVFLVYTF